MGAADGTTASGGGLAALRDQNARRVLRLLLAEPDGLTQMAITRRSGLARSTISTLLSERLQPVLVDEIRESSHRGPAARRWRIDPDSAYTVGVDIGRTHVTVCLMDAYRTLAGEPLTEHMRDTLAEKNKALRAARRFLKELIASEERCRRVAALTVGLPGTVDAENGMLIDSSIPGWYQLDIRAKFTELWPYTPLPQIDVENDANTGAVAESALGAGKNARSLLYLKWSTSLSAGLIIREELWRGTSGAAGELAHFRVPYTPENGSSSGFLEAGAEGQCEQCGHLDCLQNLVGGRALARAAGARNLTDVLMRAWDPDSPGHERSAQTLRAAAWVIGATLAPTLMMLNIEHLVVGGIAGRGAYRMMLNSLESGIQARSPARVRWDGEVTIGELGLHAYSIGGALLASERHLLSFILGGEGPRNAGLEPSPAADVLTQPV